METGMEICECARLLNCIRTTLTGRNVQEKRPDYVPPVILDSGALKWIARAVATMNEVTSSSDLHLLTVGYADRRDPSGCCLSIGVTIATANPDRYLTVEHGWAMRMGEIHHALLAHSVGFQYNCESGRLKYEFEFPVFGTRSEGIRHRNRILLIEDDPFVRHSTREILETQGYRVLSAEDAEDGLAIYRRCAGEVGLVISDVTLPGATGNVLAQRIRAIDPRVPVLLISGYASVIPEDAAKKLYFLQKPFNANRLLSALARCFREYHAANYLGAAPGGDRVNAWL